MSNTLVPQSNIGSAINTDNMLQNLHGQNVPGANGNQFIKNRNGGLGARPLVAINDASLASTNSKQPELNWQTRTTFSVDYQNDTLGLENSGNAFGEPVSSQQQLHIINEPLEVEIDSI